MYMHVCICMYVYACTYIGTNKHTDGINMQSIRRDTHTHIHTNTDNNFTERTQTHTCVRTYIPTYILAGMFNDKYCPIPTHTVDLSTTAFG